MAGRNRSYSVRYGGGPAGTLNSTKKIETAYMGRHSCTDETHPGPPYRSGGPLLVTKKMYDICRTASFHAHYLVAPNNRWDGHLCVNAYNPPIEPTPLSLSGWGAKGWNRTFPVHPIYNLGVSLIELKDFPRMIEQTRIFFKSLRGVSLTSIPRTFRETLIAIKNGGKYLGDNYLNLQFGWVPFLQDLAFILRMQRKVAQKVRWLKNKNGKSIRRKVTLDAGGFSEDIPRVQTGPNSMNPVLPTQLYSGSVTATYPMPVQKKYNRRIWYVAKYRLHIPELATTQLNTIGLELDLLGLSLDPSILYRVTPWSWLLDWFVNVGTLLQNIYFTAKYHVVAVYAYVMCSESFDYISPGYVDVNTGDYRLIVPLKWSGKPRYLAGVSKLRYEFKQREVANPFGFGITFSSLSTYQWSILTALGLSRGGKHSAPRP